MPPLAPPPSLSLSLSLYPILPLPCRYDSIEQVIDDIRQLIGPLHPYAWLRNTVPESATLNHFESCKSLLKRDFDDRFDEDCFADEEGHVTTVPLTVAGFAETVKLDGVQYSVCWRQPSKVRAGS